MNLASIPAPQQDVSTFIPTTCGRPGCGASYAYDDADIVPQQTYWYWLEEVETDGDTTLCGPVPARSEVLALQWKVFLPIVLK